MQGLVGGTVGRMKADEGVSILPRPRCQAWTQAVQAQEPNLTGTGTEAGKGGLLAVNGVLCN